MIDKEEFIVIHTVESHVRSALTTSETSHTIIGSSRD